MVWDMAEHLVEAMQDRLIELYAAAERKKQSADNYMEQAPQSAPGDDSSTPKLKPTVRTGGMPNEGVPEGVTGKAIKSSKRPTTAMPSNLPESSTPTRPSTADQSKQNPPRRLPAWAARGLKSSATPTRDSSDHASHIPQSKWAERANNQDLQILGKPLVTKEKHKLTLELTAGDSTWSAPQNVYTADKLANTLEESDGVLMMDHSKPLDDPFDTSDDEIIEENEDLEEDRLNQTSSKLEKLEESAEHLESWLERKVVGDSLHNSFSFTAP